MQKKNIEITPVSITKLAEMAGVKYQTVCAAKKIGGSLYNAILPNGKLNASHPAVIDYIERNKTRIYYEKKALSGLNAGIEFNNKELKDEIKCSIAKSDEDKALEYLTNLDKKTASNFLNMPLREIIIQFGGNPLFCEWLKAVKLIEDVRDKQIKNDENLGTLIDREFVRTHVLSLIETTNLRLLQDTPRTISANILNLVKKNAQREEIEKEIAEIISNQLKNIKLRVCRSLDRA